MRRRKKSATDNTADPVRKRKSKLGSSTGDVSEHVSLEVSVPGWLKVETRAAAQAISRGLVKCGCSWYVFTRAVESRAFKLPYVAGKRAKWWGYCGIYHLMLP